jgi:arginine utilization protein RocB
MKTNERSIEELMYELVSIQSDTGTKQERDVEEAIYMWFSELNYFQTNNEFLGKSLIEHDHLTRQIVWALVKGSSSETIILYHHHDVVDSFDFGELKEFAYLPAILKEKFKKIDLGHKTNQDVLNEDWIFGRGTADMKAGAAIQMSLIKEFSEIEDFQGNILFISVPDEENLSVGMRNAPDLLEELKNKYSLEYKFAINSEPHERDLENEYIYFDGSVGKLLMSVYVRGKKTHMGEIFKGINPIYILSGIVEKTEMNTVFSDNRDELVSPPPSWGYCRDFKERYDVSVPESAGGYISFLTLNRTPDSILSDMKHICIESCVESLKQINTNYRKYIKDENSDYGIDIRVLTYDELMKEAVSHNKLLVEKEIKKKQSDIERSIADGNITLAESNMLLIKNLLDIIPDKNPIVVLSISPPYYPHIHKNDNCNLDDYVVEIDEKISTFIKDECGLNSKNKQVFMGISDSSYFDFQCGEEVGDYISNNMPLWGKLYSIPFDNMKRLSVPVINIGPWGKDIHKISERVSRRDLVYTVPKTIRFIIKDYFKCT